VRLSAREEEERKKGALFFLGIMGNKIKMFFVKNGK